MTTMNPLLDFANLTRFDEVRPEHVTPAIDELIAHAAEVVRLAKSSRGFIVVMFISLSGALGGFHGIHQQHRNGHRTHAAWYGRDVRRDFAYAGRVDIAAQFAVVVAVHAHVDDDGAPEHD